MGEETKKSKLRIIGRIIDKLFLALLVVWLLIAWGRVSKMESRIFLSCFNNPRCETEKWQAVLRETCADGGLRRDGDAWIWCETYAIMIKMKGVSLPSGTRWKYRK